MNYFLWTIITPLSSAIMVLPISRVSDKIRNWFSVIASIITLALIVPLSFDVLTGKTFSLEYVWSKTLNITLSFKMDGLGYLFAFIASLIGFLTILFSVRDLNGELDLGTYYMWMLLFIGSMIGLAFSSDFITFFIFWELVSLCSWGLIGFWKERAKSIRASMKALLMTHISSLPLLVAILFLYLTTGTFSISQIASKLGEINVQPLITGAAIMFLLALMAKSVQVPIHTWLPEAMEAPTPVSALLHAATMVKAGVLLAVRMITIFSPLFTSYSWNFIFATLGTLSMIIAIHMALIEKDIKRILAYSTISHIGYIMLGIGIGTALGVAGGLFHLLNHAMFKACLFLCAGSVIYRVGTRNIDEMGGLAKRMPITAAAFLIAALSASGIPPFSGFASKLMIYEAALTAQGPYASMYIIYCFLAIYAGVITLATFIKVIHNVFFGQMPSRFKDIKEPPASMIFPSILLAGASILFGLLPQFPLNTFIFPALKTIKFKFAAQLSVTWLGYATTIGSYQAAFIAILLAASFGLGLLIYLTGIRTVSTLPVSSIKYGPMIGGEDAPIISYESIKVPSIPFSQAIKSTLNFIFHVSDMGGFDLLWFNIAKGVNKIASIISKYLNSKAGISLPLIILISFIFNSISQAPFTLFLIYIGILLMIIGALTAIAQSTFIRLLTWLSVSWIGRILLEFGTATTIGIAGGILDLLNIALILPTLLLVGLAIKKASGTTDFKELGGLARKMPITAGAFLISSLALSGIPPLNGWWSEYHLFMVAAEFNKLDLGFAIMLASALTIASVLKAFNAIFYGKTTAKTAEAHESLIAIITAILTAICIAIGIYPELLMSWIYRLVGG
jgi:NADH:ubiquinone oxidoreductase subunit 5 (subunit L)/multisubunit Na+/H+ antiporter MnhA subunit